MEKYSIIYADPPWHYKTYSPKGNGRSAEKHYPTMSIEQIKALPVEKLAADGTIKALGEKYGVANTVITDFSDQK